MKQALQHAREWYVRRRRVTRVVMILVPFILVTYLGARELALRSADQLTITITQLDAGSTSVIYRQAFGSGLATYTQSLLNDESVSHPRIAWLMSSESHPYYGPAWRYHLAFFWHGLLIETADMTENGGPETYSLSALGIPDLRVRVNDGPQWFSIVTHIAKASSGVVPLSPYTSSPGYNATPSPNSTP